MPAIPHMNYRELHEFRFENTQIRLFIIFVSFRRITCFRETLQEFLVSIGIDTMPPTSDNEFLDLKRDELFR
jgi:hypothetical protein